MRWCSGQRRRSVPGAIVLVTLLLAACHPGAYPLDIFPEMHHQASQRPLEPNRLAPPAGAVPVTGAKPQLTFPQATNLQNPLQPDQANVDRAGEVYRVNCAMCHGQNGDGQSIVAQYFRNAGVTPPVAFSDQRVRSRTDGQLYWLIRHGIGNMPAFDDLLSEQDIWLAVLHVRQAGGG